MNKPKVLFFDLEMAGVRGLCADQGFVVCFGYKWEGQKKPTVLSILDHPGKNCQDDTELLKASLKIMEQADLLVAHFGSQCDRPYLESRLLHAKLAPLPLTRLVDTCLIARSRLKLSSNRLDNLARFVGAPTRKMSKGDGWPDWWMGVLRGDKESVRKMAVYCGFDVQCLAEIYERMKHIIPGQYLIHPGIGADRHVCGVCGGPVQYRGTYFSALQMWRRFQCIAQGCGKWGRENKAIARNFRGHQPSK